ncbi:MAG: hypothetical protein KAY32_10680 [Candidatus Eisenbacteria sp.]|nr:hypothetical protein [Candidatus Eisenbacteria bacterium]
MIRSSFRRGNVSPYLHILPLAWLSAALLLLAALVGCGSDGGGTKAQIRNPEDFLPRDDVSNWQLAGEIQTGSSYDDLYGIINGGAEIYDGHGMRAFATANYDGLESMAGAVAVIWVYEMDSAQGARDLYEDPQIAPGSAEAVADLGEEARISPVLGGKTCEFIREKCYVNILVAQTTPQDAEIQATFLAGHVDAEIVQ